MIEFKPRYFVLPAIAVVVLAMLHGPATGGRSPRDAGCATPRIADPEIRASFVRFQRRQSGTAAKICAVASNNLP